MWKMFDEPCEIFGSHKVSIRKRRNKGPILQHSFQHFARAIYVHGPVGVRIIIIISQANTVVDNPYLLVVVI